MDCIGLHRSRREFVALGVVVCSVSFALGQTALWNNTDPPNYSYEEKHQLLTNSPWAKAVKAKTPHQPSEAASGTVVYDRSHIETPPVILTDPVKERDQQTDGTLAYYGSVIIRWESATPLLEVGGTTLPDQFHDHYAISVWGLPAQFFLKTSGVAFRCNATMHVQGHKPEAADFAMATPDKTAVVFAFSSINLPIKVSDKQVIFTANLAGTVLKAGFVPKEMLYRGQLLLSKTGDAK